MAINTDDAREVGTPVQRLAGLLLADVDRLARLAAQRMQEVLPSSAKVPLDELTPIVLANTRNLLEIIVDPEIDRGRLEADYRASGETRARQGIAGDEMLHAWRL